MIHRIALEESDWLALIIAARFIADIKPDKNVEYMGVHDRLIEKLAASMVRSVPCDEMAVVGAAEIASH